jgi:hypothetical protein
MDAELDRDGERIDQISVHPKKRRALSTLSKGLWSRLEITTACLKSDTLSVNAYRAFFLGCPLRIVKHTV